MSRLLLLVVLTVAWAVLLFVQQQPSVDTPAIVPLYHHMLFDALKGVSNCSSQRDALLARAMHGTLGGSRCAARSAHEHPAKAVMAQRGSIGIRHV